MTSVQNLKNTIWSLLVIPAFYIAYAWEVLHYQKITYYVVGMLFETTKTITNLKEVLK